MYRVAGIGTSLFFVAVGAILAWAVDVDTALNGDTKGVDWNMVGLIIFIVGVAGLLIALVANFAVSRQDRTTVIDHGHVEPTRERILER